MSFKKKIDKILEINSLGVNSINALENEIGSSTGSVNKYYNNDKEPGPKILKKIKKTFGISDEDWKTGAFMTVEIESDPQVVLKHYRKVNEHLMSENRDLWGELKKYLQKQA